MMKMRLGKMLKFGDVVIAKANYLDVSGSKKRPALVLYEELGNIVVAAITSNPKMRGVGLSRKEGAIRDSVIKLNYVFTCIDIHKKLFTIPEEKNKQGNSTVVRGVKLFSALLALAKTGTKHWLWVLLIFPVFF